MASARAGNVIGGGDWALDRIIPDAVRALSAEQPISVRNPAHIRPWQHVLDPLSGYLLLGASVHKTSHLRGAFNFGPHADSSRSVRELVEEILRHWPGTWHSDAAESDAVNERAVLRLSIEKAKTLLNWRPTWDFAEAVRQTARWYGSGEDAASKTADQIHEFETKMSFTL